MSSSAERSVPPGNGRAQGDRDSRGRAGRPGGVAEHSHRGSAGTARRRVAGERSRSRAAATATRRTRTGGASRPGAQAPATTPADTDSTASPRTLPRPKLAPWARKRSSSDRPAQRVGARRRRGFLTALVALVAGLVLLATVVGLSLRDPGASARSTRAASSAAQTTLEQMLSYNYKTIDAQAAQVETLLTGAFKAEFTNAMDTDIKPLAVKNQTVVQAKVSDIGVMEAGENRVKVMAFVNQATVGADKQRPAVDQNRVIATMSRVGDRWLVSELEAF